MSLFFRSLLVVLGLLWGAGAAGLRAYYYSTIAHEIEHLHHWGKHLGPTRHSSSPAAIQVQEEVLMNAGSFRQTAEPIPILNSQGQQIKIGGYDAYYLDLIEL
jgi:hypothetical protein